MIIIIIIITTKKAQLPPFICTGRPFGTSKHDFMYNLWVN